MGIGAGVFLIVVGAILAFAIHADVGSVNIQVVGGILIAAGLFIVILTMWRMNQVRRKRVIVRRPPHGDLQEEIEEERIVDQNGEPGPPLV